MKILFLEFRRAGQRGGEIYHTHLHTFLKKHFADLTPDQIPSLPSYADTARRRMNHVLDICRQEQPDVVVSDISSASRNYRAVRQALGRGGKLVLIAQSVPPSRFVRGRMKAFITARCEKYLIRHADTLICNSRFTRDSIFSRGKSIPEVVIAPPGLEVSASAVDSQKGRATSETLRLLYIGECSRVKGLIYLVRAISRLKRLNLHLDVVGGNQQEPEYESMVRQFVKESALEDRVAFHGYLDRVSLNTMYAGSDLCVVPSLAEGYGMVAAEALAFGLPVLASRVGALTELVIDSDNGLLVSSADDSALASAIERLASDRTLLERLSAHASESARNLPTWDDFERLLTEQLLPRLQF